MSCKIAVLTGRPGIGKTTTVLRTADLLKMRGFKVGGFVTVEVRHEGRRVGFELVDILDGVRSLMASESLKTHLRVGRYGLYPGFGDAAADAVSKSMAGCDVTVVDEIGPMELKSPRLVGALYSLLEASCTTLVTVHYTLKHPLIQTAVKKAGPHCYILDESNRGKMPEKLVELLESWTRLR